MLIRRLLALAALAAAAFLVADTRRPGADKPTILLPNGWKLTPTGRMLPTADMVLNLVAAPDGKSIVGSHSGFNPHGLDVVDLRSEEIAQRIALPSTWFGLAWHPGGGKLYVSGSNDAHADISPIYVFGYRDGRLTEKPLAVFKDHDSKHMISWSGLAHHPSKDLLYAADRGAGNTPSRVFVLDSNTGKTVREIPVGMAPYDVLLNEDGSRLYVSNWASQSVSVIDTASYATLATIPVDHNPNDLLLARDGRLFVACANDNSVVAIDTKALKASEKIVTSLYPRSPGGSTPNALAFDRDQKILYVANADNNNVALVSIAEPGESDVKGFVPTGWYPSALALAPGGAKLYVACSKGGQSYPTPHGPASPAGAKGSESIKTVIHGGIEVIETARMAADLKSLTRQVYANCPYNDELLKMARARRGTASIVPRKVGAGSPIKHVIYIIKENRTYDQVYGDITKANGDPNLCLFGRKVTPNQHAIAEQYVLFDNLYCDGEVSADGHQWSNGAYATDYMEKHWPPQYGKESVAASGFGSSPAVTPSSGYLWDACQRKGLTYRSYGEFGRRTSEGNDVQAVPGAKNLNGHFAPDYKVPGMRDTDNARTFIREFDEFERNYASKDPARRLPNFIVMSLGENHTRGTSPGAFTPVACVASNDQAVGMIVERVSHSKYWPETAIFIIEDDAQNGPDHVDAHRTAGLAISPYIRRGTLDSTHYTTSAMLRTIELLLGLPPMSQYDAAANPMFAAFGTRADLTPFTRLPAGVDLTARNPKNAWGAQESLAMDFSDYDLAPELELNRVIWKSVKGADSEMPLPIRRFR